MGLYEWLVWMPLRRLYLLGPPVLGFWGGQAEEDICAQVSRVPSHFWTGHYDECRALVDKRLQTFVVTMELGLYTVLLYRFLSAMLTHWSVVRPLVRELRKLRKLGDEEEGKNLPLQKSQGSAKA